MRRTERALASLVDDVHQVGRFDSERAAEFLRKALAALAAEMDKLTGDHIRTTTDARRALENNIPLRIGHAAVRLIEAAPLARMGAARAESTASPSVQ